MTLSKTNCELSQSEKGNLYISHPEHKTLLRFYADIEELKKDKEWRARIAIRSGKEDSYYAVLSKSAMKTLDL